MLWTNVVLDIMRYKTYNLHESKRPFSLPLMYFQMLAIVIEVILLILKNLKTCCHFLMHTSQQLLLLPSEILCLSGWALPRRLLYNLQTWTSENRSDNPQSELLHNFRCELHFLFLMNNIHLNWVLYSIGIMRQFFLLNLQSLLLRKLLAGLGKKCLGLISNQDPYSLFSKSQQN